VLVIVNVRLSFRLLLVFGLGLGLLLRVQLLLVPGFRLVSGLGFIVMFSVSVWVVV
jgi:hypothetical protein